jgi:hypothetical protein
MQLPILNALSDIDTDDCGMEHHHNGEGLCDPVRRKNCAGCPHATEAVIGEEFYEQSGLESVRDELIALGKLSPARAQELFKNFDRDNEWLDLIDLDDNHPGLFVDATFDRTREHILKDRSFIKSELQKVAEKL